MPPCGVDTPQVKLARNLNIVADCSISECTDKEWDVIACPGGMPGATHMSECAPLISMLKKQKAGGKLIAAVCASPAVIFAKHGLLDRDAQHTCYPAPKFREAVPGWVPDQVTSDASVITSQGPGTSLQFALRIVEKLYGREKATELAEALLTELC